MDSISEYDVILLANALSIKSGLNVTITSIAQCTSDFALALYLSVMGELPEGAVTDCSSIKSREHNVSCIVESLENDYLHVDLSHISSSSFVAADPVTIFNLFEILDGLLDFMLEQIDLKSDSGEEGDVDSDISSVKKRLQSSHPSHIRLKSDVSSIASDLSNADISMSGESARQSPVSIKMGKLESARESPVFEKIEKLESARESPVFEKIEKLESARESPVSEKIKKLESARESPVSKKIEELESARESPVSEKIGKLESAWESPVSEKIEKLESVRESLVSMKDLASPKSSSYATWEEDKPAEISEHTLNTSLSNSLSETYVKSRESKFPTQPLSEQTFTLSDSGEPSPSSTNFHSDTVVVRLNDDRMSPRPMLVDSLPQGDELNGGRILEDMTNSLRLRQSLKSSDEISDKLEPIIRLEPANKISGISISDFTSESSKSEFEPPPAPALSHLPNIEPSGGDDVTDGIPKPDFHHSSSSMMLDTLNDPDQLSDRQDKDWKNLLQNLQKTVEESKRVREKYFATPKPSLGTRSPVPSNDEKKAESLLSDDYTSRPLRQRNVRFEDTVSTGTAQRMEDFKKVLQKEKDLQGLKNKILSTNYQDHLEEVEENERRKMQPLVERAGETEKDFRRSVTRQRKKRGSRKPNARENLVAAAKWRSWQAPVVVQTPQAKTGKVKRRINDRLVIGEHDLLPILMSEFPGLELSSTTLNNAWKKQFRQIEMLTKQESEHALTKRLNEKRLEEAHNRHELLIEIMRKEHEHNQRVRDAKERAAGEQEAMTKMKDRRQQSARVRRYYRDYQLQMKARMLKRRTREEKLFKNLFEEGLKIQRSRLNDIRRYARDKRTEEQIRQRNEIASLENYYKDQFAMLAETLESEKKELKTRNDAQTKLLRQMTSGLRKKMEQEISSLQEQIARDDDDIYYRELEADRIRRQLQLATYNAKFHASITNKLRK